MNIERRTVLVWTIGVSLSLLMLIGILGSFVFHEKKVTVFVDGQIVEGSTNRVTVKQFLQEQQIELSQGDVVLPDDGGWLKNDLVITIIRGKTTLLMVDGQIREIIVPVPDIKQILLQEGVSIGPLDKVEAVLWPEGDIDEVFIKVTRIKEETFMEEEEIEYTVRSQPDYRLPEGRKEVIDAGEKGLIRRQVQVIYEDGEEVIKEVIWEATVREPKQALMVYGTAKSMMVASRGGYNHLRDDELRQVLAQANQVYEMEATAYTHTGNATFTGIMPYVGVVAVDPRVIPLGTRMYVEGYGFGLAADTGGVIKGNIVDVFMDTREEALKWGRRQVRVYILD
jgi:3D (Asp-Asp-Asp) domain-containing protein